jgi:hypothetical protein
MTTYKTTAAGDSLDFIPTSLFSTISVLLYHLFLLFHLILIKLYRYKFLPSTETGMPRSNEIVIYVFLLGAFSGETVILNIDSSYSLSRFSRIPPP